MIQTDKRQGSIIETQDAYLATWVEAFLQDRRSQGMSPGTLQYYRVKIKLFAEWAKSRSISQVTQITPQELRVFLLTFGGPRPQPRRNPRRVSGRKDVPAVVGGRGGTRGVEEPHYPNQGPQGPAGTPGPRENGRGLPTNPVVYSGNVLRGPGPSHFHGPLGHGNPSRGTRGPGPFGRGPRGRFVTSPSRERPQAAGHVPREGLSKGRKDLGPGPRDPPRGHVCDPGRGPSHLLGTAERSQTVRVPGRG